MNEFLKLSRLFYNKTLQELSTETGISIYVLDSIEKGQVTASPEEFDKIAEAFSFSPADVRQLKDLPQTWLTVLNKALSWIVKDAG